MYLTNTIFITFALTALTLAKHKPKHKPKLSPTALTCIPGDITCVNDNTAIAYCESDKLIVSEYCRKNVKCQVEPFPVCWSG
jgi:hypothetical protein